MAQKGIFGEIVHAEGAYIHDLRALLLSNTYYQDQWRLNEHINRNGNLYTTHGLGPISFYLNIGRGDTFSYLTSMSSRELNLSKAAKNKNHPIRSYSCGDMNNTLIKTEKGKTILKRKGLAVVLDGSRIYVRNSKERNYPAFISSLRRTQSVSCY